MFTIKKNKTTKSIFFSAYLFFDHFGIVKYKKNICPVSMYNDILTVHKIIVALQTFITQTSIILK